jgi:hypothetical protein
MYDIKIPFAVALPENTDRVCIWSLFNNFDKVIPPEIIRNFSFGFKDV